MVGAKVCGLLDDNPPPFVDDGSPRPRVLLGDDRPDTLTTQAILLRDAGYSVATAVSGRQCVAMLGSTSCGSTCESARSMASRCSAGCAARVSTFRLSSSRHSPT